MHIPGSQKQVSPLMFGGKAPREMRLRGGSCLALGGGWLGPVSGSLREGVQGVHVNVGQVEACHKRIELVLITGHSYLLPLAAGRGKFHGINHCLHVLAVLKGGSTGHRFLEPAMFSIPSGKSLLQSSNQAEQPCR